MGGLTLDHYEVSSDDGLNWVSTVLANFTQLTGLVNGQEYILRVKLFTTHPYLSALVEGATLVTEPFYPYKAASVPIFVSCVEGDEQLVLTWSEPSDLGGLTRHHYEISIDNWLNWVSTGTATSYTFTGLENGQPYSERSRIITTHINLGSITGATLVTESFYPYKASAPPQNLTSEPEDGKVVFNWTAADATINGLPFVTYQVSVDNSAWTDISTNTHSLTGANGVALILYFLMGLQDRFLGFCGFAAAADLLQGPSGRLPEPKFCREAARTGRLRGKICGWFGAMFKKCPCWHFYGSLILQAALSLGGLLDEED